MRTQGDSPVATEAVPDGEQLAAAVSRVRPVIVSTLGDMGSAETVEDVSQSTWESAWRGRDRFDPHQGSLHSWVVTIARRRAIDVVRAWQRELRMQHRVEQEATGRGQSMLSVVQDDHAEDTMLSVQARQTIVEVLSVVKTVILNRESTARGMSLLMVFGDDVRLASRALGVSADRLRQARRELVRCCQVVVRAQQAVAEGKDATLRVLIECLPQGDEAGNWASQMGVVVARAGGSLTQVAVADVMEVTGLSFHTARQYLAQTQHLLRVAATVINTGPGPATAGPGH